MFSIIAGMQKYDLMVLAKEKGAIAEKIEKVIKALGGVVTKAGEMGKKPLAYTIAKSAEAEYLSFGLELPAEGVVQLKKKLAVDKEVLRHLLVRKGNK